MNELRTSLLELCSYQPTNTIDCATSQHQSMDWLLNYQRTVEGFADEVLSLMSRCGSTARLLRDRLEFKDRLETQKQSEYILQLTHSTVDDSATVRVITVITLVYLSFSVVAVRLPPEPTTVW